MSHSATIGNPLDGAAAPAPGTLSWIGVTPRQLAAFLAMVFGMFMAILDIQIVSASLAEIQAGLSASADEISWVQTSYLIAEVVMIPLSGFLARVLSTRILFTIAAAGFTAASVLCATATTIDQMIVYRAIQGFIGGGMIPSVFAVAFSIFPPSKRGIVSPLIGLVATLAPTIGPTVGGYLSNAFTWHWLFLVNVGPGIIVTIAVFLLVDFDEPDHSLLKRFDYVGLGAMALFLGSLEYVLEEGPRYDWFDDRTISTFAILTAAGAMVFFWRALTAAQPIVELRAFKDRNFAFGSAFSFVMGIGLYGLTYLYPVYLSQVRGYDALMIGAGQRTPVAGHGSARHDDDRVHGICRRHLPRVRHHGRLGLQRASSAADPARLLADDMHGADQQPVARHAAAGSAQECVGSLQSDAQSRRRRRSRAHQHASEPQARSAPRPSSRERRVGAPGRRGHARRHDAAGFAVSSRWRSHRAEAACPPRAQSGERHVLCGRVPGAHYLVREPGAVRHVHEKAA
jgi:MFS family permease